MAEVSSPQRKQKTSLGGFLESNSGSSNTQHARQEGAQRENDQERIRTKPKRVSSSKLKRRSAQDNDDKDILSSEPGNGKSSNHASQYEPKKPEATENAAEKEGTHQQPKSSSKVRSRRGPPPRSKSFNLDGIMSAEGAGPKPFVSADDVGGEEEKAAPNYSEAVKPASKARGKRAAFSRSKSFNLDGQMSAEGAGPKPFTGTGENGSDDQEGNTAAPVTRGRALPTRSQSSKSNRNAPAVRKPMSRGRSFDDTGNSNPIQLQRIPRNPHRGVMLEKQPSQRNMRRISSQEKISSHDKIRRGGKKPDRSPSNRTSNSGATTKKEGATASSVKQKRGTDSTSSANPQKTQPQHRNSLEKLPGPTPAEKKTAERDSDAFTVDFPETMEVNTAIPTTNATFHNFSAEKDHPPTKKKVLDMTHADDSDDSDEEGLEEGGGDLAGIMQFDPTAMDNVKVVRHDSQGEFPTDYLGCAVDMGLNDNDDTNTSSTGEGGGGTGGHHDTGAGTPSSLFGKTGRGFFQSKKIAKPGSFRSTKKKQTAGEGHPRTPTISAAKIAQDLEEAAAPITQATAAMGAAVANLTKGWTITSGGVQRENVGHQQFDD